MTKKGVSKARRGPFKELGVGREFVQPGSTQEVVQLEKTTFFKSTDVKQRIHRTCKKCKHSCKQSSMVILIKCPQFIAKESRRGK